MPSDSSQTVEKALEIMDFMAMNGSPMTVREIASSSGVSTTSAYRILAALNAKDATRRLPDGKHVLGSRVLRWAATIDHYPTLRMLAAGPMMEIRETCGMETVGLYVRLNNAEMTCIEVLPGMHSIQHVERRYDAIPIARGATSLAFLSQSAGRYGEGTVRQYLLNLAIGHRPTDIDTTMTRIAQVQIQGFAHSSGDRVPGATALACPISSGLTTSAVLTVSGPASRFRPELTGKWGGSLCRGAAQISAALSDHTSK